MKAFLKAFFVRHEPPVALRANLRAGLAAIAGIALVGGLATWIELPLLIAPLGPTSGLLFGQPSSALSQP
ncbi:HPP family protein, partial [Escherichia coli]|nr:HPP family protein [Escherichia coli]